MSETTYGKTPLGQLLYDLAYTNLSPRYLARKHRKPVAWIRGMRSTPSIKSLRKHARRKK